MQGSALANRLREMGHYVITYDDNSRGKNRPNSNKSITCDLRNIVPDFYGLDAVYHLAARIGGVKFTKGGEDLSIMLDNASIDNNVLRGAIKADVGHVVFASSASVYPLDRQLKFGEVLREGDNLNVYDLESGYATCKLSTEMMMYRLSYARKQTSISVLRLFNVYGPGEDLGASSHVIPELFRKTLNDKEVKVYGDGRQERCFLYVDDAVDAFVKVLDNHYGGPLNIGSSEIVTIKELAESIVRISGTDKRIIYDTFSPTGMLSCVPNVMLAKEVLGWTAKTPLYEGLKKTMEWIKSC